MDMLSVFGPQYKNALLFAPREIFHKKHHSKNYGVRTNLSAIYVCKNLKMLKVGVL